MKNTALAELRSKTAGEMKKMADDLRDALFRGRLTASVEGKGLGGKVRQMRRQVARLETLIREQSSGAARPVAAKAQASASAKPAKAAKKVTKKSKDNA